MSTELIVGLVAIVVMLVLIFLKIPIAISMFIPAALGITYLKGFTTFAATVETVVWTQSFNHTLSTIPLFILMGYLLHNGGISSDLFLSFKKWFGNFPGGLGIATIGTSGVFAAASGSSLANTATMGTLAAKEMIDVGYDKKIVSGSIIAGGTLGPLIPPSTLFIIYGVVTQQSIGQLLIAGIVPGILLMILFSTLLIIIGLVKPHLAPRGTDKYSIKDKLIAVKSNLPILFIFGIVMGGMYTGITTPTEAAAIGAVSTLLVAVLKGNFSRKLLMKSLLETLRMSGFLFAILIMSFILNYFLTITKVSIFLLQQIGGLDLPNWTIFALIVIVYLLLGMIMDGLAMMVITVPILLPLITSLDLNLIWFGVILVILIEIGMMTPPVGMNCFVLNSAVKELELSDIFKGALIFVIPMLLLIIVLYLFPDIVMYLPNNM
jgi:C4-dicarboxylate transporter DctM subunit